MNIEYSMAIAGCISAAMAVDDGAKDWVRTIQIHSPDGSVRTPNMNEFRAFIRAQSIQLRAYVDMQNEH